MLQFPLELLQLLLALLPRPEELHFRFRPPRALVVARLRGGWLDALPIMQGLLPLLLVSHQWLEGLLPRGPGGRRLHGTLLLELPQLQGLLLLLPLQLMLVESPRARFLGTPGQLRRE